MTVGTFIDGGTFGRVYRCHIGKAKKVAVIKVFGNTSSVNMKAEVKVFDKTKDCSQIPNFVYSGFDTNAQFVIVMEGVFGGTLYENLKNNSLSSLDHMKAILFQIAEALEFLHRISLTHGYVLF